MDGVAVTCSRGYIVRINLQRKALFFLGPVGGHSLVNRVRLIEIIIELAMLKSV